ncbi:MAG: hypothetical protein R2751_17415 [Bacteroidales bacterium]
MASGTKVGERTAFSATGSATHMGLQNRIQGSNLDWWIRPGVRPAMWCSVSGWGKRAWIMAMAACGPG